MNESVKVVSAPVEDELDVKRFYLPGTRLEMKCPECAQETICDFGDQYLSYPPINKKFAFTCYCNSCEHNWPCTLKLILVLEVLE